jgi:DNA-binding response OmpR family regulator
MPGQRLLIIDDEVAFAKFVARVASAEGFDVKVTTRSEDFMAAVLSAPPDVIILDMVMPGMDGVELIQWLAKQQSTARVILASGFNPLYAEMAEQLGASLGKLSISILTKPVRVADLRAALLGGAQTSQSDL